MASAGLLFLMLLSSSFLISTVRVSAALGQNQQQENSSKKLNTAKIISTTLNIIKIFTEAAKPFMLLLPDNGKLANALLSLIGLGAAEINKQISGDSLQAIISEFEKLNFKLDQYHVEQKWETWASGAYHKPEMDINQAWENLMILMHNLNKTEDEGVRQREKEFFMNGYPKSATQTLYDLLTAKSPTFINPLEKLLAEHVKCHEKDIKQYTLFIIILMYKGSLMNNLYYEYMKVQSQKRTEANVNLLHNTASAMFQIHMNCIANSKKYIENDLRTVIDRTQTRLELAKNVKKFLEEVYDRYDWVVVAFITKKSQHTKLKSLNSHVLSGFNKVPKEGITVAVARQVKGNYTKAAVVKEAIDKCIDKSVVCHKVAEKLRKCRTTVEGKPVSQTYTAVHAYLKETPKEALYEDYDISAAPEDTSNKTPYIYKGKCQKSKGVPGVPGGRFIVLIKSDEEIKTNDPCSMQNCGTEERGKCVGVKDVFLGLCECKYPYYGEECKENLKDLEGEISLQSRSRFGFRQ